VVIGRVRVPPFRSRAPKAIWMGGIGGAVTVAREPVADGSGAPAVGLTRSLVNWLAGTVMILAGTLSVGKFLLGTPLEGSLYLVADLIGAVVIRPDVAGRRCRDHTQKAAAD